MYINIYMCILDNRLHVYIFGKVLMGTELMGTDPTYRITLSFILYFGDRWATVALEVETQKPPPNNST